MTTQLFAVVVVWAVTIWRAVRTRTPRGRTGPAIAVLIALAGLAVGLTTSLTPAAEWLDSLYGVPLSPVVKRLAGLVGAYGIAALIASILGRGGRVLAGGAIVAGVATLVSYLAGGYRWGELETFLAASPWPDVPDGTVASTRVYFGMWDGYLGLVLAALAVTHAEAMWRTRGWVRRTQSGAFTGAGLIGVGSPVSTLGALTGWWTYDLETARTWFIYPCVLLVVFALILPTVVQGRSIVRGWWLWWRLGPMWRRLTAAFPPSAPSLDVKGLEARLYVRVQETFDAIGKALTVLDAPDRRGRGSTSEAAVMLYRALALAELGKAADVPPVVDTPGLPDAASTDLREEAAWLLAVWSKLQRTTAQTVADNDKWLVV
ncbi:hypothetical protein SAMN05421874_14319 [Nonomuraea maritima]|uniref:DUF6545 domain-containing protein n=1 Tax=Nonomuraea maritima TaxID=683260 RepID=A0A1G9R5B1_9ACTN|nr:DUF6545 domain-containing protein [Nonomuraea maritima]SDM18403.1 hypothetical protein SAMN05421874_14319 [Nonomuraea maritima]